MAKATYTQAQREQLANELKSGLRKELKRIDKSIKNLNINSLPDLTLLNMELNNAIGSIVSIVNALKNDSEISNQN